MDYQLVRVLQRQVADQMTAVRQAQFDAGQRELVAADERQLLLTLIRQQVAAHIQAQAAQGHVLPDPDVDASLVRAVEAAIFGAGALQPLLDDPSVENIDINGSDVWVTYADARGKVLVEPVADSDEDLIALVSTLAAYHGPTARPFTPATPELDLRLVDGSRLSAIMTATPRPVVSIRRHRLRQIFLARIPPAARARPTRHLSAAADEPHWPATPGHQERAQTLVQLGTVDPELAAFLEAAVRARLNIVVAGATDSGKTTLLRALIHCIPAGERLITVERALELGLSSDPQLHPDVVELEEVLSGPDGGGVSIGQLVRRSRRLNPSRVIVGEVLGPEVVEMLSAMSQGNDGSLSTIHARSAGDVFARLATYAAQHEHLDFAVTHSLIGSSVDLVVFIRKDPRHARRVVSEVLEVTGSSDGRVTRSTIFTPGPDGRAVRQRDVPFMRGQLLAEHGYSEHGFDDIGLGPEAYAEESADRDGFGHSAMRNPGQSAGDGLAAGGADWSSDPSDVPGRPRPGRSTSWSPPAEWSQAPANRYTPCPGHNGSGRDLDGDRHLDTNGHTGADKDGVFEGGSEGDWPWSN